VLRDDKGQADADCGVGIVESEGGEMSEQTCWPVWSEQRGCDVCSECGAALLMERPEDWEPELARYCPGCGREVEQ